MMATQKKIPPVASQTTPRNPEDNPTFLDHICELRNRVFVIAIVLIAAASLGYSIHDHLVHILLSPLHGQKLVYLTPGGGFDFIFKISLYFGFLVAIPIFIYQFYRYMSPLMQQTSRRFAAFLIGTSTILATTGVMFGYFIAVPAALNFLIGFGGDYIVANLTASSYLSFVTIYLLGLALLFQLPLIMLIINSIRGPIKPSKLFKSEGYVVLGAFIVAAMITPTPDIINQSVTAAPIIIIYQLGILFVAIQNRSRRRRQLRQERTDLKDNALQAPKPRSSIEHLPVIPPVIATPQAQTIKKAPAVFKPLLTPTQLPSTGIQKKPLSQVAVAKPAPATVRPTIDGLVFRRQITPRPLAAGPRQIVQRSQPRPLPVQPVRAAIPIMRSTRRQIASIDGVAGW